MPEPSRAARPSATGESAFATDELAAQKATARTYALATSLLAATVAVFAATWLDRTPGFWVGLVRASSQAGIVGGLADWFAVTAVFRHPFGIPVPHTAVLPRNKDRIGRALGAFVERSFLTEAVLLPRLRAAKPARRFAAWLSVPANAATIVEPALATAPNVIRALDNPELRDFLNRVVGEQLRQIDLAPLVGESLQILTRSGEADMLFDRLIEGTLAWAEARRPDLDRLVQEQSSWWVPQAVNRHIARKVFAGVTDLLGRLLDREGETRRGFQAALERLIERLKSSPEEAAELNAARDRLLARPELAGWINAVWGELSRTLAADAGAGESRLRAVLEGGLVHLGRELLRDAPLQAQIDAAIEAGALQVLGYRGEIARFIADVVHGWDADTVAQRLELVIGGDLQYIRINGTVVGALAGCGIYLITRLLA